MRTTDDGQTHGGKARLKKTQVHLFTHTKSSGIFWEPSSVRGLSESFRTSDLIDLQVAREAGKKIPTHVWNRTQSQNVETVFRGKTQKISISGADVRATSAGGAKHPTSVTPEAAND